MIKPQLAHVGVYARDLDKMRRFYSEVFGLTVTDQGASANIHLDMIFMSADPGEHHQFVLIGGRADDGPAGAVQQISFLVRSLDEMRELRDKIVAEGLEIKNLVNHGNAWSFYFADPEDNYIEVYAHTPWYTPQPLGEPFDLDRSDEDLLAETEALCRAKDGFATSEARQAQMRQMLAE